MPRPGVVSPKRAMDGCVRRQLSAGKEGRRRRRLVRSGFAAALVDVVLHQGDDLLQLVVQLGATRRGVGLQSTHHLKRKRRRNKSKKTNVTFRELVHSPAEVCHLPGRSRSWRGENSSSISSSGPLTRSPPRHKSPLCVFTKKNQKKKPHLLRYSRPIVVTRVSGDLLALSGGVLAGRAG